MKAIFPRFTLPTFAALMVLISSAARPTSAIDADMTENVPTVHTANMLGYDRYSSPALADIDGDGRPEILVGTEAGYLVAMKYSNGALQTLWQTNLGASIGSSPAVGDLDGNGQMEIVVGVGWHPRSQPGRLVVLDRNGSQRCQRTTLDRNEGPDGVPDGVFGTPALGDIDQDGKLEITVVGYDEELYVLNDDCSDLVVPGSAYGWPRFLRDNSWGSPALADLNHDGRPEIVIGSYYHDPPFCPDAGCGVLWVFDDKGNNLPGWPRYVYTHLDSSPVVTDIDRDGQYEILIGTGQNDDSRFYRVYAFRADGSDEPGWPQATNGWVWSSPTTADVEGDGYQEIFAASADIADDYGTVISHGKLYGWRYNGQALPNWPVTPINQNGEPQGTATASSPTVVDVDGDGQAEVFITSGWDVVGFDISSAPLTAYRLHTWYSLGSTPAWGDLNGDGLLEATIGGGHYNDVPNGTGRVYVWDIGKPYAADKALWPMWRRGAARTGLVPPAATLTLRPNPLTVVLSMSSGSPAHTSFNVGSNDGTLLDWSATASDSRVSLAPTSGRTGSGGSQVLVTIDVSNLGTGWHDLGTITVNANTTQGRAFNSPAQIPVRVLMADRLTRIYLLQISK